MKTRVWVMAGLLVVAGLLPLRAEDDKGMELYDRGLYEEAVAWWTVRAGKGDMNAHYRLGDYYEGKANELKDLGDEDEEKVQALYRKAAAWYEPAAMAGDPRAQLALGSFYDAGAGVDASSADAVKWFAACANRGNPNCQFNLGKVYETGKTMDPDPVQAYKWYYIAAKNGFIEFDSPELTNLAQKLSTEHKREAVKEALTFKPAD